MISDWSGAALEFAFACERPVLFVDVPRKVNNDQYAVLDIEPIEVSLRQQVGEIFRPGDFETLTARIRSMTDSPEAWAQRIRSARDDTVFNIGTSAQAGADIIQQLRGGHASQGEGV